MSRAREGRSMHQWGPKDKKLKLCEELFHDPFNVFGKEKATADTIACVVSRL